MLRMVCLLAGLPAFAFATTASAQKLLAPADPIATIEGEWTGVYSESRVRVRNGTVTLVHVDPKDDHHGFKEGMVIGRLRDGGKSINDGRGYSFHPRNVSSDIPAIAWTALRWSPVASAAQA